MSMQTQGRKIRTAMPLQKGFTLIELLVTIAIAAILLSIGVPSMANLIRDARLSTEADGLVTSLNLARSEAVKTRTNYLVCPSAEPNSNSATCSESVDDWSKGWITKDLDSISQRSEVKSGLAVETTSTTVTFNGTLGSASGAASFKLCSSGRKQQVVSVSPSGHISKSIGTETCP